MEPEEQYDYIHSDKLSEAVPSRPHIKLSTAGYNTSSSLTLAAFLAQHTASLPVTMTACTSYSGGKISLCQGQQYIVLALREQKCVSVKDMDQNSYILPLHSPIQFGLVHHTPITPPNLAVFGIRYETADELMKQHMIPSVVCSIKSYKSKHPDGCVDESELLVLQELKTKGALRKGPAFQAYSVTHRCMRSIGRHCDSGFTTHPEKVKMPLVDIVSHVPQPFPSMAVAFIEADQSGLPRSLSSKLVMLEKMVTRAVMVVRAAERTEGEVPFDLPVDTPVRVNRSADPSSAPRRSDESGDGSSDELRTAGGTSSPRTGRAGSAGSDASAGSAVRGSSGSGRSVGRMNSAPPPLPLEEDIYDNEQEAHYLDLIPAVEKGRGDPMVCPLPAKPYNGLPKYDAYVASVKMSGSGDSGTPSDAAVERPDEDSQELIYDYARDEDLDRLS
eukprot:Em0017g646a